MLNNTPLGSLVEDVVFLCDLNIESFQDTKHYKDMLAWLAGLATLLLPECQWRE